ncbi:MAG: hypothetical protein JW908_06010 [Anaerolineales bacterium]|nr:hypothetical protein [Anaerolineales bacterium]
MKQIKPWFTLHRLIQLFGVGFLLSGVFFLWAAPQEIYTFYAFIPGGKFHFDGFGFGSFMFAYITVLVLAYYTLALICIPLGYGHLTLKKWAHKITLTLLWDWIIIGLPLSIIGFLMLLASKSLPQSSIPVLIVLFLLIYPVLPLSLIGFYRRQSVQHVFIQQRNSNSWFDQIPKTILVLGSLLIFFTIVLQFPLLFNGIFPVFGKFIFGSPGVNLIALVTILLIFLSWGILNRKRWSWWGSMIVFPLLIISVLITFLYYDLKDIIAMMNFAPLELELMQNIPVQSYQLLIFFCAPLLLTFIILVVSKPLFTGKPSL